MHNLLRDKIIRVQIYSQSIENLSLPQVYDALARDEIKSFVGLRPHQSHAWHAFLAQLAVIALNIAYSYKVPNQLDDVDWYNALRKLTTAYKDDEPWNLVVDDLTSPAFMQTPCTSGVAEFNKDILYPDDLDLLVTSKNHVVKQGTAIRYSIDDWVYALINLQTMAPYSGRGNQRIARMNGSYSSRPCLGLAPIKGGLGAYLFHDINQMISNRNQVIEKFHEYYLPQNGKSLLWLEPWNGSDQLSLVGLDPYFIEVCRRIRLFGVSTSSIRAKRASSKKCRIAADHSKGNLGDHWTPINLKDGSSLSIKRETLHYQKLSKILIGNTFLSPNAMKPPEGENGPWRVIIRGMAGGQGKTDGYHERTDLLLSHETCKNILLPNPQKDDLGLLSKKQLEEISGIESALKKGIAIAASGKTDLKKQDWQRASPFIDRFHNRVDSIFFWYLDKRFNAPTEHQQKIRGEFGVRLIQIAREIFQFAIHVVRSPLSGRHRARALAKMIFEAQLRKCAFSDQPEVFLSPSSSSSSHHSC